ncbi:ABC-2 type transport system permease protein [Chitinophaga costaii]|uniref:ABC-2 type transport system permease protein n=1 Tax=Chitinophaga costaii TaxID=1335309 RepID=A0A1C4EU52_9BACT|nr:Gldg family protein [Chitinophaga costaii]PUZ21648.1 ABC transporter permease [Chitinophaga costaii]SCC47147.1 ABC-2 type transport system permease protein [Chitinophaga costaii]
MRVIFRVARQELSLLFNSPIAWLILIVFPIQIGVDFLHYIQMIGRAQRMGHHFSDVTMMLFAGKQGFYPGVKNTLYLYIPLLTMGLISRETHSGSIKLLLSSPIKVSDIVLGKYMAMMGYGALLLVVICLYSISGSFFITHIDWTLLASGALGLYLLICAYAAIGLFMSSLTTYQVVAAISTLAVLAALNFIGSLFQGNDAVRHITYFISLAGRTEQLIVGLISTEDLIYFILVISFFLCVTTMRLQDQRDAKPRFQRILRYMGLVGGCCIVAFISTRPQLTGYVDMTASKVHTIGPQSRDLVKQMKTPLKITTYVNILDNNYYLGAPEKKSEDERLFIPYRRFMPGLQMDYLYYYDFSGNKSLYKNYPGQSDEAIARKVADIQDLDFKRVLPPAQVRKMVDLAPEQNRLVRQLQYGDRKTFLRYFDDVMIYPSEQETTAALKRIVTPGSIPVITFVTGNGERSISKAGDADFRKFVNELGYRAALINQGFDIDTVNLAAQNISATTAVLVLADPTTALPPVVQEKINQYIASGRNLLVVTEPGSQDVVRPVLQTLGVKPGDAPVQEASRDYPPDFLFATFAVQAGEVSPQLAAYKADSALVSVPGALALQYTQPQGFHSTPLLVTKNHQALALALQRKQAGKDQRIVVTGDADFMSTAALSRLQPFVYNQFLITELFRWFSYGAFPVNTGALQPKDVIDSDDKGILTMRILFFGLIPVSMLTFATWMLLYRKRR